MAKSVTVYLPESAAGPVRVRNGAYAYTVKPGGQAEVPERIAPHLVAQGATTTKPKPRKNTDKS